MGGLIRAARARPVMVLDLDSEVANAALVREVAFCCNPQYRRAIAAAASGLPERMSESEAALLARFGAQWDGHEGSSFVCALLLGAPARMLSKEDLPSFINLVRHGAIEVSRVLRSNGTRILRYRVPSLQRRSDNNAMLETARRISATTRRHLIAEQQSQQMLLAA